jgi:arylsulfatase A-like enzyme
MLLPLAACLTAATAPPNVIVIMTDDQGYADAGCYGSEQIRTPNFDRLAQGGMRFTDWHSPSPVCSPSRAGLLTGCLPARVGLAKGVLFPTSTTGLDAAEVTIADVLKQRGYATACFGKWHLGHRQPFLPRRHGFDAYLGIPYSNDMTPRVLMQDDAVAEQQADLSTITRRYTDATIAFIEQHRAGPFFVYLPHTMPHLPLAASPEWTGKSAAGPYGDAVEEIDHELGRLLGTLDRLGLAQNTLVVYTSDNGPWKNREGRPGKNDTTTAPKFLGSAGPFRGSKGDVWEGGHRVPCVWRLPGTIPAGTTCDVPAMHTDVLPSVAALCGAAAPTDRGIDGADLGTALRGTPAATLADRPLYHYTLRGEFAAVRSGRWKWHLAEKALYDLQAEPGETTNVAAANAPVVEHLSALAKAHRADLAANARKPGSAK